jgi:hypothetical protein
MIVSLNRISAWWAGYMLGSLFDAVFALCVIGLVWWLLRRRVAPQWGYLLHWDLTGTPITDEGLVHLQGLTNLRVLDLHGTRVTLDGVQRLRQARPHCAVFHAGRPEAKR